MRKFHAIFLSIALLCAGHAFAQKQVQGMITDSVGAPLANVSVQVLNSASGTRTDARGAFSLQVPSGASVLVVSSVGYETQQINIANRDNILVTLHHVRQELSEVVVTALGIVKDKRSLGYSTQTVKGSEIANKGELNVVNGLKGWINVQSVGG